MKPVVSGRPDWAVGTCIGREWSRSVLADRVRTAIRHRVDLVEVDPAAGGARDDIRVLITGWGSPSLTGDVLDRLPSLELVLHAAGSVRGIVTEAVWERGIRVSTAVSANAVSVADFTCAQVHLSLKNVWRLALDARAAGGPVERTGVRGVDGATIGLVGLGHIGRLVARRLAAHDLRVLAYDPFTGREEAAELGVELADLATVIAGSDVLTLHAPHNDTTHHMISTAELDLMPPHGTLLNTARGGLVDHDALVEFLTRRRDVFAVLDVTEPEVLPVGHPLFRLGNALVTPHIAGSLGTDEARLGDLVAAELVRFIEGDALEHEVNEERLALSA
ncbi:phosphoglycerate dehydrogenase-like enzyme [Streptosporangium becharense]|uniref:Phosphoglycerate dehydrogenase-like enzyme n=1 Tax=Streptosporangium becharense TaxID=1816182 RepID=A0A7W9IDH3_9ACTN|nr:hydroxyacid dehydrogenase [Streptosporangium becharense]MBB5818138.1 phosphoglycerate dehydrogenase-like enzyme [Streptosporangium becharense]